MMEQAAKFKIQGRSSEFFGELQQDLDAMRQVKDGKVQLLYISPSKRTVERNVAYSCLSGQFSRSCCG